MQLLQIKLQPVSSLASSLRDSRKLRKPGRVHLKQHRQADRGDRGCPYRLAAQRVHLHHPLLPILTPLAHSPENAATDELASATSQRPSRLANRHQRFIVPKSPITPAYTDFRPTQYMVRQPDLDVTTKPPKTLRTPQRQSHRVHSCPDALTVTPGTPQHGPSATPLRRTAGSCQSPGLRR